MFAEILRENGYTAYRARLQTLLGIPASASDLEIHQKISAGLPASRLMQLSEEGTVTPLEREQIIPLRTLKARIERDQALTVDESDRFFRSAHIRAMADAVFGDIEKSRRWLAKPKERFAGQSPMQMLTTQQGAGQVEEMLLQIAEGFSL